MVEQSEYTRSSKIIGGSPVALAEKRGRHCAPFGPSTFQTLGGDRTGKKRVALFIKMYQYMRLSTRYPSATNRETIKERAKSKSTKEAHNTA